MIDEEQLAAYVKALGSEYNTAYTKRKFKTSYGPEVEVAGVYGWRIDGAGEKARLKEEILAGEPVEREPVYLQTAASREGNDYGTTYAEVNLTAQHLFFIRMGKKSWNLISYQETSLRGIQLLQACSVLHISREMPC